MIAHESVPLVCRDYADTSRPGGRINTCPYRRSLIQWCGEDPASMDTIVMIMFASVICTMTALSFMELRRIRKKLESKDPK